MNILRWGEWAEVIVEMMVEVKPDENLLILTHTAINKEIGEACLIAGINAKAKSQLLVIPEMGAKDCVDDVPVVVNAISGADVIVSLGECQNASVQDAMLQSREKGARVAQCNPKGVEVWVMEGVLDVDYPRMSEICEKICELWGETEVCRVKSELGTDISFRLKGRPCDLGDGRALQPGEVDFFPGATPSIAPVEDTIEGTIVIDGTITAPIGSVREPVTLRLEKGIITAIEGGADADALRSRLESADDPKAFQMCHWNVGVSPRAEFGHMMGEDEMAMGVVTFGFGNQDPDFEGTVGRCAIHTDVTLRSPTVYLDGVVMCENNRFNSDLGLSWC